MAKPGAAILLRAGHDMFSLLRDDIPTINAPLTWSVLAGGIEEGEDAEKAMYRELREEIGFCPTFHRIGMFGTNAWHVGTLTGQELALLRRGEGCGHGFFSFEALQALAKIEGKGGLGGALRKAMLNAPEEIQEFLAHGKVPSLEKMFVIKVTS